MVPVRNGAFETEVLEAGNGSPLLFLHGWAGVQPGPFLDGLAASHRLIAPLHPGYGRSSGDEHLLDLHDLLYYYLDFLDELGLRNLPVVAHSLGAMFAAELAAMQPERFSRLVLLAPFGLWNDQYPVMDFFVASPDDLREAAFADPESEAARALTRLPENEGDLAPLLERVKSMRVAAKYLWPIPNRGLSRRIHRVTAPALIAWGEDDRIAPARYGADFQRLLRGSRLELVPRAGHFPQVEQPEAVLRLTEEFLRA